MTQITGFCVGVKVNGAAVRQISEAVTLVFAVIASTSLTAQHTEDHRLSGNSFYGTFHFLSTPCMEGIILTGPFTLRLDSDRLPH